MVCPRCGEAVPVEPAPPALRCSAEAYELLGRALARRRQERFVVVALDARNRPVRCHVVAVGSVAAVVVRPREVFAPLIRDRAVAAIVLHNHPSGGPVEPSVEDTEITRRLADAGKLLGIPLLDHLVVGKKGYYSFRDAGGIG
jgi:DNA repair protein RadC